MAKHKVGMLTAGGLAPCLSSAVGGLIERYSDVAPEVPILGYVSGYKGLLLGQSLEVTPAARREAHRLHDFGGSPLGNSRVKLTNAKDCVKRGLVKEGQDPLQVAAEQLRKDGVTILHTVGGDDTNTTAADLAAYLGKNGYQLTVIGLPKTVDNDIVPIRQSLGAVSAAEAGARFFENVVGEHSASPRMLVVHEVMGRHSGWLTAATARTYRARLDDRPLVPSYGLGRDKLEIHGVYLPELEFDLEAEVARLKKHLDQHDCCNLFVSEGACVDVIVKELESRGETVTRDAFGHVKLDSINVGDWFSKQLGKRIGAEKTLVQKSGYFARSAAANREDLMLIKSMVDLAVDCGLRGESGVIGHDEEQGRLRAIELPRIKGGKGLDVQQPWVAELFAAIGQPRKAAAHH